MPRPDRVLGSIALGCALNALVIAAPAASAQDGRSQSAAPVLESVVAERRSVPRVTDRQLEDVDARIATATRILNRLQDEARTRGLADSWRQSSLDTLLPLPLGTLRQVEQRAFGLDALTAAVGDAADDPQVLGDGNADLVYTPIVPCRFIDTRGYVAGKISGDREFDADLTGASYGGTGACNPRTLFGVGSASAIGALAINVTIVDTSAAVAPGFVAVKPTAAAPTTSLLNWYEQGATVQIANQGIVSLDQEPASNPEFVLQTSGAVHVIVDIFGAFIAPEATTLDVITLERNVNISAHSFWQDVSLQCPSGYRRTGGGCQIGGVSYLNASRPGDTAGYWYCSANNTTNFNDFLRIFVICARIPGR